MNLDFDVYSGPLDVLLHMVKKSQVDIYEVDLKLIIDEYLEFINTIDNYDLDGKSEYLIMASELIHLKSKLLLGFDDEESDENYDINSEEDLRTRLIEFEKYQSISNDFRNLEAKRQDFFTKVPSNMKEYYPKDVLVSGEMDVQELFDAFLSLQKRLEYKKPVQTKIARKELSIKDKINYIKGILNSKEKVELIDLLESNSKEEIVITFLSVLEMSKNKDIKLFQEENFSKIFVEVVYE